MDARGVSERGIRGRTPWGPKSRASDSAKKPVAFLDSSRGAFLAAQSSERRGSETGEKKQDTPVSRYLDGIFSERFQWAGECGVARKLTLRATGLKRGKQTWISKGFRVGTSMATGGRRGRFGVEDKRPDSLGADATSFCFPKNPVASIFRFVAWHLTGGQKFRTTGKPRIRGGRKTPASHYRAGVCSARIQRAGKCGVLRKLTLRATVPE